MSKLILILVTLLVITSLVLGGCTGTSISTIPTTAQTTSQTTSTTAQTTSQTTSTTTQMPTISDYDIKILKVEKNNDAFYTDATHYMLPSKNYTFLVINLQILKNDITLKKEEVSNKEIQNFSVIDNNGKVYPALSPIGIVYEDEDTGWYYNGTVSIHFSILGNSTGLKLQYRDLPLIDLGL